MRVAYRWLIEQKICFTWHQTETVSIFDNLLFNLFLVSIIYYITLKGM